MSGGVIAAIVVVAVLLVVAVAAVGTAPRLRRQRLRQRYGPEYDRAVSRHQGDTRAAEQELSGYLRRYGGRGAEEPLATEVRERYRAEWLQIQEAFVDDPRQAVRRADRLVAGLLRERGYPEDGETLPAALTARGDGAVDHYRVGHRAATAEAPDRVAAERTREDGGVSAAAETERLREALLHSRELFDMLLGPEAKGRTDGRPQSRRGERRALSTPGDWFRVHGKEAQHG
jgi:hypothetical protein